MGNLTQEEKEKLAKTIKELLLKSPKGMTAKEISSKIKIDDLRVVRDLTRSALKQAQKESLTTARTRLEGQAIKVYSIKAKK